jgi:hypothetical protein
MSFFDWYEVWLKSAEGFLTNKQNQLEDYYEYYRDEEVGPSYDRLRHFFEQDGDDDDEHDYDDLFDDDDEDYYENVDFNQAELDNVFFSALYSLFAPEYESYDPFYGPMDDEEDEEISEEAQQILDMDDELLRGYIQNAIIMTREAVSRLPEYEFIYLPYRYHLPNNQKTRANFSSREKASDFFAISILYSTAELLYNTLRLSDDFKFCLDVCKQIEIFVDELKGREEFVNLHIRGLLYTLCMTTSPIFMSELFLRLKTKLENVENVSLWMEFYNILAQYQNNLDDLDRILNHLDFVQSLFDLIKEGKLAFVKTEILSLYTHCIMLLTKFAPEALINLTTDLDDVRASLTTGITKDKQLGIRYKIALCEKNWIGKGWVSFEEAKPLCEDLLDQRKKIAQTKVTLGETLSEDFADILVNITKSKVSTKADYDLVVKWIKSLSKSYKTNKTILDAQEAILAAKVK